MNSVQSINSTEPRTIRGIETITTVMAEAVKAKAAPINEMIGIAEEVECLAETLGKYRIDLSLELEAPAVCLEITQDGEAASIGTLGNFSLVIGKAKSRKTFFITIALAAAVKNSMVLNTIKGSLPDGQPKAIFFDTEQGKYHVQKAAKRVCSLSSKHNPPNFEAYSLRGENPSDRLAIIEAVIYNTPGIGFVVIDGIRDLVTSINDEEQSTAIASKLLKWTEELNIHIMCVLHQNKGDTNARGHLGTELVNKAETVLSITKDATNDTISLVEAEYCREKEPRPFAFEIDEEGLPAILEDWMPRSEKRHAENAVTHPSGIDKSIHFKVLRDVFKHEPNPRYGELCRQVKIAFQTQGASKIGDNKIKEFVQWYVNEGMITKGGKPRSPTAVYSLGSLLV